MSCTSLSVTQWHTVNVTNPGMKSLWEGWEPIYLIWDPWNGWETDKAPRNYPHLLCLSRLYQLMEPKERDYSFTNTNYAVRDAARHLTVKDTSRIDICPKEGEQGERYLSCHQVGYRLPGWKCVQAFASISQQNWIFIILRAGGQHHCCSILSSGYHA